MAKTFEGESAVEIVYGKAFVCNIAMYAIIFIPHCGKMPHLHFWQYPRDPIVLQKVRKQGMRFWHKLTLKILARDNL